jgi:hypothetical protein
MKSNILSRPGSSRSVGLVAVVAAEVHFHDPLTPVKAATDLVVAEAGAILKSRTKLSQ